MEFNWLLSHRTSHKEEKKSNERTSNVDVGWWADQNHRRPMKENNKRQRCEALASSAVGSMAPSAYMAHGVAPVLLFLPTARHFTLRRFGTPQRGERATELVRYQP